VAGRDGKPTNLTLERLRRVEREIAVLRRDTNARLEQTNARLEQVVDVLTRLSAWWPPRARSSTA